MILSAADQTRFPKYTHYLKTALPGVARIAAIASAMQTTGQLDRTSFRAALRWGTPPTIRPVRALAACGSFTPIPANNIIEIRESIFTDFEAGRGWLATRSGRVAALGLNVLHEMVHWGDNLDGVDRCCVAGPMSEEGDEFENLVNGRNLGC